MDVRREDILTPKEAADILGVAENTIRAWVKKGKLPGFQPGPGYPIMILKETIRMALEGKLEGGNNDEG